MTQKPKGEKPQKGQIRNRLGDEVSAYLLQHANNPVDWHPWGAEALNRAKLENRPLLISIGYSACHWCHVMEHESFEDSTTADIMNAHFINIKVDREERPDLDQIYMDAVTRLNEGQGGWPLTVFCTPEGRPFFGGTYYPPEPRHGMPSFTQVLEAMNQAWNHQRSEIDDAAQKILMAMQSPLEASASAPIDISTVTRASHLLMRGADTENGGFGRAPKFPTPPNLEFQLSALDVLPAAEAKSLASHLFLTAKEMARRGLFDHLAGGFHRYCVDSEWTIPHFEKMLYDQGLLLRFYAELIRRGGGRDELAWPIRETVAYLRREMTSPEGGFYASQDADADGVEGAYQVWTPDEIKQVLGDQSEAFCLAYGVNALGNFEGATTHLTDQAREPREAFQQERTKLLEARTQRVAPETDRKRVAAWNGYVISGLVRASEALDDAQILKDAKRAMDFVLDEMINDEGKLHRVFNVGRAAVPAFLDDHAALLEASLDLYRAGAGERFLTTALHFAQEIGDRFYDSAQGLLFYTAKDGEALVHRPQTDPDGATPASAGLAALGLIRLAQLSGLRVIQEQADAVIQSQSQSLVETPHALPTLLRAAALRLRGVSVAVIIGERDDPRTQALADRARRVLLPDDAVVCLAPGEPRPTGVAESWLRDREPEAGQPTAWVCRGTTCSLPATRPEDLQANPFPQ